MLAYSNWLNEASDGVLKRLDILIRLTGANLLAGKNTLDQIRLLSGAGLKTDQIAQVIGKDSQYVSKALYKIKRETKGYYAKGECGS